MPSQAPAPFAPPSSGVTPSAMGALLRDRSLRLAGGLAIAVAIPVAVLFYFQFRSLTDLGQASTVVLRQLSQETADGIAKSIDDALKAPHIGALLRVSQRQAEPLDLPSIAPTFEDSLTHDTYVSRYYVWSDRTTEHRGDTLAYDRSSHDFIVNPPEGREITERIRQLAPRKRAIVAFTITVEGRKTYVQAQLRFATPEREVLTSYVGFAVDGERLRREFFPALLGAQLGAVQGPIGFPALQAVVRDDTGAVVYPVGLPPGFQPVHEREFPLVFFDKELLRYAEPFESHRETWKLQTGYGTQTIPAIISARARPQRLLMAMLAGVMGLSVFFVARAAAREVRLAELKSNFVSSVSHDLKTPLALIQLFAETLELGRLKNVERTHEYYRIINSEARKLTRLINNLLDFSRIEAGLRRYRLDPTDLGALTRRVIDALGSQFDHHQYRVTLKVQPDMALAMVDAEAAEQAIENLLSNAMKYSPDHRDIFVDVDVVGRFGRVRVTDRGIGIPPRLQRKVFRKFYRVQNDAGSGPQGTGLGLSIVDHVMRAHGGFVRVDSEPGVGSTFTLHFPLCTEAQGDETDSGDRGRAADAARTA